MADQPKTPPEAPASPATPATARAIIVIREHRGNKRAEREAVEAIHFSPALQKLIDEHFDWVDVIAVKDMTGELPRDINVAENSLFNQSERIAILAPYHHIGSVDHPLPSTQLASGRFMEALERVPGVARFADLEKVLTGGSKTSSSSAKKEPKEPDGIAIRSLD